MKKPTKVSLAVIIAITMTLTLAACGGETAPTDEPVVETTSTPEPTAAPTDEPEAETTPPPEPTPESTPEPTPEPAQEFIGYKFPFGFSTEDLHGNTVTEETLGEKELFFAYLWAVW